MSDVHGTNPDGVNRDGGGVASMENSEWRSDERETEVRVV